MTKQIVITVNEDGSTKVEGMGFKGKACDLAMKPIEEALGLTDSKKYKIEAGQEEKKHARH